MNFEV
jgi:glutathione peroxidase-family protein